MKIILFQCKKILTCVLMLPSDLNMYFLSMKIINIELNYINLSYTYLSLDLKYVSSFQQNAFLWVGESSCSVDNSILQDTDFMAPMALCFCVVAHKQFQLKSLYAILTQQVPKKLMWATCFMHKVR